MTDNIDNYNENQIEEINSEDTTSVSGGLSWEEIWKNVEETFNELIA
ncbi:hypothetical protein [Kordiimonas laminariae]|nr:hypothetical protein [Kordiimonas laminariae]MCK0069467.1 hypothetical protein [Kordiimonas laminariae]